MTEPITADKIECDETGRVTRMVVDGVAYVPERTCRVESIDRCDRGCGSTEHIYRLTCGHYITSLSVVVPIYCQYCGAKVVG